MREPTIRTQHDRTLFRAMFLGLIKNIPSVHHADETPLGLIVDEDQRHLEFTIMVHQVDHRFLHRKAIIASDVPLLVWLLREVIRSGAEVVSWPLLLQSLGEVPSEENKHHLLSSAWRLISTTIRYRVGPRRGTFNLCGDSSWGNQDAWFAFDPGFLKIAQCAFDDLPQYQRTKHFQRAKVLPFERNSA